MWIILETLFKKLLKHIPRKSLTNYDLLKYVKLLGISNFRGVFMRDKLPKRIKKNESGIVNLDDYNGDGTHWTAYIKKGKNIIYFDSYGNLRPPVELITYFYSDKNRNDVNYNYNKYQNFNKTNCGQLCLKFLYNNM